MLIYKFPSKILYDDKHDKELSFKFNGFKWLYINGSSGHLCRE